MDDYEEKLNNILLETFNSISKVEESALRRGRINASISEVHLIDAIGRRKTATVSGLADDLGIARPSVTIAVDKLISKGYLSKIKNASDKRRVCISLTRDGMRVYRIHKYFHQRMIHEVTKDMCQGEKEALYTGISKLNDFFIKSSRESEGVDE